MSGNWLMRFDLFIGDVMEDNIFCFPKILHCACSSLKVHCSIPPMPGVNCSENASNEGEQTNPKRGSDKLHRPIQKITRAMGKGTANKEQTPLNICPTKAKRRKFVDEQGFKKLQSQRLSVQIEQGVNRRIQTCAIGCDDKIGKTATLSSFQKGVPREAIRRKR